MKYVLHVGTHAEGVVDFLQKGKCEPSFGVFGVENHDSDYYKDHHHTMDSKDDHGIV